MTLTQKEVQGKLCEISARVAQEIFKWDVPADCFCSLRSGNLTEQDFSYDQRVIDFIRNAVEKEIHLLKR